MIRSPSFRRAATTAMLSSLLASAIPSSAVGQPGRATLDQLGPDIIRFCAREIQAHARKHGPAQARYEVGHLLAMVADPKSGLNAKGRSENVYDREEKFRDAVSILYRPGNVGGPEIAQLRACVAGRSLSLLGPSVGTIQIVRQDRDGLPSLDLWERGAKRPLPPLYWASSTASVKLESGQVYDLEVSTAEGVHRCPVRVEPGQFTVWNLAAGCPTD